MSFIVSNSMNCSFFDPVNFSFPSGSHICEVEVDPETGETLISSNEQLKEDNVRLAIDRGVTSFDSILIDNKLISPALRDTLIADKIDDEFDASNKY